MNLLNPIQQSSMFIPTNLGIIQHQLDQREQEYNQKEAMIANEMDKYSQIESHPSAMAFKEAKMNQLRSTVDKLIADRNGDIGAIDLKSLTGAVHSIRPDIQLMQRHGALAEEQRKFKQQYGADAWAINDASDFEKWRNAQDADYTVRNMEDYRKTLAGNFGHLATAKNQGSLTKDPNRPGFLVQDTRLGISEDKIDQTAEEMAQHLMKNYPELANDPTRARALAQAYAPQLAQGRLKDYTEDPYALLNYKNSLENPELPQSQLYDVISGAGVENPYTAEGIDNAYNYMMNPNKDEHIMDPYPFLDFLGINNAVQAAGQDKINELGPMFRDLTENFNLTDQQALSIIKQERQVNVPTVHSQMLTPKTEEVNQTVASNISKSFDARSLEQIIDDDGTESKTKTGNSMESAVTELKTAISENKVKDVKFDLKDKQIRFAKPAGGYWAIPFSAWNQHGIGDALSGYSEIHKSMNEVEGPVNTEPFNVGGRQFRVRSEFVPKKGKPGEGRYVKTLFEIIPGDRPNSYSQVESSMEGLTDYLMNSIVLSNRGINLVKKKV